MIPTWLPGSESFVIIADVMEIKHEMNDTDDPIVEVKLAEDKETSSVVVTFPFHAQALAFRDICHTIVSKMKIIAAPQNFD